MVKSRIFYRCVDWNHWSLLQYDHKRVASFTDAWIETSVEDVCNTSDTVASFTDAWIETWKLISSNFIVESHLLQMRGLKLFAQQWRASDVCRIFYRCVDWNVHIKKSINIITVASFTDAWIETWAAMARFWRLGRIFYRCVDWNILVWIGNIIGIVASFTDAWIETFNPEFDHIGYRRIFYRCVDWNYQHQRATREELVASFTDAWIETHRQHLEKETP